MRETIEKRKLREFGLLLGILFPFFIGFVIPYLHSSDFKIWTFYVTGLLFFIAIFNPEKLFILYKSWIKIGHILGFLNSKIILGIIFLFILQPIAFIMRIFGYDPLKLKRQKVISFRELRNNDNIDLSKIF
mgnify:CR=1 FL=1